jgi:hypothetical protein
MTTTPGFVTVATAATDAVFGVNGPTPALNNEPVNLQSGDVVQLLAGGTIVSSDLVIPTSGGAVVTTTSFNAQFVSTSSVTSGRTFSAQRVGSVEPAMAGPIVYGSRLAPTFVADLASGANSLDIVIIGDSNTGSAQSGMWGYHNGFSQAMFELGWACYGLPIYPAMSSWSPAASYALGGWNASAFLYSPTGNLASGNVSGGSTSYSVWTPGKVATVTISNASPGVVTYTGHGLTAGAPVFFDTNGLLPPGLSITLTSVAITNTTGNFTCAATSNTLAVGQPVRISGTFTNGNSITSYSDPTVYYIIATNGSTTFQLSATRNGSAVTTVVGTAGVGATFNASNTGYTYFVASVLDANTFTVASTPTGSAINTTGAGSGTHTIQTCPWIRYGSASAAPPAKDDWAYIASGSYAQNFNAIEMAVDHPLNNTALTLFHRVRYGTFTASGGSFQARARAYDGGPVYASGSVQSTQGAAYSFGKYEYSFSVTAPTEYMHASWSGGAGGAVGPCAIHSHTIYCKRKGWSVTSHGYLAGYDSASINQVASSIGSTLLQTHLQELRERQMDATGTGRVLLVTHSGINGNETESAWTSCHTSIWNTYKSAWAALGYPASDLAIVSFVGVPSNAADNSNNGTGGNLIPVRAAANALPTTQPDMMVIDIKKAMPYSRAIVGIGNGRSYYQRTNNLPNAGSDITVHLSGGIYTGSTKDTSDGYTVVAHEILQALLNNA